MANKQVVKASEVVGVGVINPARENLGEINEIVLDKVSGTVTYLVLDFGGFMGFGNKFFAIPWNMFSYDPQEDSFILNLSKDQLKDAPGFDKDHWPNFASSDVANPINKFYSQYR